MSRVPRQHRRFSLPATLTPFGLTREIPEGSDMFQKALEDLCTNEPENGLTKLEVDGGFRGLCKIQEDNESDYSDNDEAAEMNLLVAPDDTKKRSGRRHSSPNCYASADDNVDKLNKNNANKKDIDSIMKTHNRFRTEYFKRHGRWPVKTSTNSLPSPRPKTSGKKSQPAVAFGTKVRK